MGGGEAGRQRGGGGEQAVAKMAAELRVMQHALARFSSLKVDSTEYTCLKAITLFKAGTLSYQ